MAIHPLNTGPRPLEAPASSVVVAAFRDLNHQLTLAIAEEWALDGHTACDPAFHDWEKTADAAWAAAGAAAKTVVAAQARCPGDRRLQLMAPFLKTALATECPHDWLVMQGQIAGALHLFLVDDSTSWALEINGLLRDAVDLLRQIAVLPLDGSVADGAATSMDEAPEPCA